MASSGRLLLNAGLFQLGWFACVLGAQRPLLLLLALVCLGVHLAWLAEPREWRLLLGVSLIGWLLDSALLQLGLFDFHRPGPLLPAWLALLWPLFASTLRHSLAWSARPWWRASLFGALGGPLSYWAGSQLAGVGLPLGTSTSMLVLALLWALLLPLLQRLSRALI
ncbi:DUF2878 domain-containing protein [Pseudomonas sp. SDI]|uniref:DUF2878 domain-containing protein n=1 Tax=Pseudomonas sp. SDI TaxID=2170734 RepID=UPI000DE6BF6B|nr:DUF2878 domain-containing protein [Pseudomonas sp. SDI]PWB31392.1 DUF2878 domain-containing protein [Pseudomonas sp. SDI]